MSPVPVGQILLPAFTAEDQGSSLVSAIAEDAWLVIPFLLGFMFFSNRSMVEQTVWRWCQSILQRGSVGVEKAVLDRRDSTSTSTDDSDGESVQYDLEYSNEFCAELSAIRSEILRERGSVIA